MRQPLPAWRRQLVVIGSQACYRIELISCEVSLCVACSQGLNHSLGTSCQETLFSCIDNPGAALRHRQPASDMFWSTRLKLTGLLMASIFTSHCRLAFIWHLVISNILMRMNQSCALQATCVILPLLGFRVTYSGWENVERGRQLHALVLFNHTSFVSLPFSFRSSTADGCASPVCGLQPHPPLFTQLSFAHHHCPLFVCGAHRSSFSWRCRLLCAVLCCKSSASL